MVRCIELVALLLVFAAVLYLRLFEVVHMAAVQNFGGVCAPRSSLAAGIGML